MTIRWESDHPIWQFLANKGEEMSGPINFEEYTKSVLRTWNTSSPSTRDQILNASLGLGEAGEVQNLIKKFYFHGPKTQDWEYKILDELGDVLYYVTALAVLWGSSLQEIAYMNKLKLEERYPDGFKEGYDTQTKTSSPNNS